MLPGAHPTVAVPWDLGRCPGEPKQEPRPAQRCAEVFTLFVSRQGRDGIRLLRRSWKELLNLPGLLSLHPETQRLLGLTGSCWKMKLSQSHLRH